MTARQAKQSISERLNPEWNSKVDDGSVCPWPWGFHLNLG